MTADVEQRAIVEELQQAVLRLALSLPQAYRDNFTSRSEVYYHVSENTTSLAIFLNRKGGHHKHERKIRVTYTDKQLKEMDSDRLVLEDESVDLFNQMRDALFKLQLDFPSTKKKEFQGSLAALNALMEEKSIASAMKAIEKKKPPPVCAICGPESKDYPAWTKPCPHLEKQNANG